MKPTFLALLLCSSTVFVFAQESFTTERGKQALRAAIEPAEGVAENAAGSGGEQRETEDPTQLQRGGGSPHNATNLASPKTTYASSQTDELASDEQDFVAGSDEATELPHLYTFIDAPAAEQRQVFLREDIEKLHAESLPDLFRAAGIQTLDYGSYGMQSNPSVRGFTGGAVRVVVDGVDVNSSQNGNFDFTSINPADIERIEITRGGFNERVSGEGAAGGVIYITTKSQIMGKAFRAGGAVKSFFNAALPLDSVFTDFGLSAQAAENTFLKASAAFTNAQNRFMYTNALGKQKEQDYADVTDCNVDLKMTHFFADGASWSLGAMGYGAKKHIPVGEGEQKDFNANVTGSVLAPTLFTGLSGTASFAWLGNNQTYNNAAEDSTHHLNELSFLAESTYYGVKWLRSTVGASLTASFLDSTNTGSHSLFSGTIKESTVFKITDWFSVSVPLSVMFSGKNAAFVPRLGAKAEFDFANVVLSGYRLIQFPTMNQLYWDGAGAHGNEDLDIEDGWGAELTLDSKFSFLPLSVCVFTDYYRNSIHWGYKDGVTTPLNMRSAFYFGVDARLEKTLFGILTLSANAEYLYNRLLDKSDEATYGNRIMWTPDLVAAASARLSLKKCAFSVQAQYTGKKYEDNMNLYAVDPYWLLNANAELLLWQHAMPYLCVNNILDKSYEAVPGYPMPRINATLGVNVRW